jgi:LPXTG-site transpeptidase (sortase) family protein
LIELFNKTSKKASTLCPFSFLVDSRLQLGLMDNPKSKSKPHSSSRLRKFNNFLSVVVLLSALYLIIWPFLPRLDFWWKSYRHSDPPLVTAITKPKNAGSVSAPKDNTLVIPALHMQVTVYDGPTYASLAKGVWHSPRSSTPDKGGNTVMAGHRFTYNGLQRGASTFYSLDRLKTGDQVVLYWSGVRYDYKVSDVLIVAPTEISIENPTPQPQLTLYTCTPLWTSLQRLVVQASLVK